MLAGSGCCTQQSGQLELAQLRLIEAHKQNDAIIQVLRASADESTLEVLADKGLLVESTRWSGALARLGAEGTLDVAASRRVLNAVRFGGLSGLALSQESSDPATTDRVASPKEGAEVEIRLRRALGRSMLAEGRTREGLAQLQRAADLAERYLGTAHPLSVEATAELDEARRSSGS